VRGLSLLAALAATGASAATLTWDGGAPPAGLNGTFGVANNWNPNDVPGAADTARFTINDGYTVNFNASALSNVVEIEAGTVTFQSSFSFAQNYNVGDLSLLVGALNIGSGAPLTGAMMVDVGDQLWNLSGAVNVSGGNSRLNAGNMLGRSRVNVCTVSSNRMAPFSCPSPSFPLRPWRPSVTGVLLRLQTLKR